jgi:hypothetical protein
VIKAGTTRTVTVKVRAPSSPGDTAYSLVIDHGMTVPIIVRSLVPIAGTAGGTFSGVLTGGNGRAGQPAQANIYAFDVPAGMRDLDASLVMGSNPADPAAPDQLPGDQFISMLVDPFGQVQSYDTNYTIGAGGPEVTPYLQLYRSNPVPGTWQMVVDWVQPQNGVAVAVPFTGAVRFNLVSATADLPDSPSATISATTGQSFNLTVHNTGVAPMLLSPDARLPTTVAIPLSDLSGLPDTQDLPGAFNFYWVPTETSSINVQVAGSAPVAFDASYLPGDPDLSPEVAAPYTTSSITPTLSQLTFTPPTGVSAGVWATVVSEIGPYSTSAPLAVETTTFTANTLDFDPAVSSPAGDTVQAFTTGNAAFSPVEAEPGATVTIPIKVKPTAAVGSTVSGTLFVNGATVSALFNFSLAGGLSPFSSDLAAIPYKYTVTP